jgi:hypothetical protein
MKNAVRLFAFVSPMVAKAHRGSETALKECPNRDPSQYLTKERHYV